MLYEYTLTVPAGTLETSPAEIDALVEPGILMRCEVDFPPGCHRLVHVVIVEGKFQLFPRNPEEALTADDYVIPILTHYIIKRGHNLLKVKGWSPTAKFSHNVIVRLTVEPEEPDKMLQVMTDFINIIKKLIGL